MLANHLNKLLESYYGVSSPIFRSAKCAEGCDVWEKKGMGKDDMGTDFDETDYKKEFKLPTFHICAIEVKNQRTTPTEDWNKKFTALSDRCIVWWLPAIFDEIFDVKFHVVFAGRENQTE